MSNGLRHTTQKATARASVGRSLIITACLCGTLHGSAQQDPAYAFYMWNMLTVNPAHAGTNDRLTANLLGRQQWAGLAGAPRTQTLTAHSPLASNKVALGGSLIHDEVGPSSALQASGDFAYRIRTGRSMRLAFGLKAGLEWMQVDLAGVPDVESTDPAFQQNMRSAAKPNFGSGLYWWSAKGFVGFSVPRLLEHDAMSTTANGQNITTMRLQRTYHVTAGRVFHLNDDLKLQAWCMAKGTAHAPVAMDATVSVIIQDQVWLGVSRHGSSTLAGLIAYRFMDRVQVGYAYGSSTGGLRKMNDGTHEVLLSYDVNLHGDRTLSPRYF